MKYKVNVKDDESSLDYLISVCRQVEPYSKEDKSEQVDNLTGTYTGNTDPTLCYQIAHAEYEHSIKRMERLDNKIYILLTVCAFIFVMLTNAIGTFGELRCPSGTGEIVLVSIYGCGIIIAVILVIILLTMLIRSLSTMDIKRFDSFQLLERQMYYAESGQVAGYVISKMERARDQNNKLIDNRYKRVNTCVRLLILSAIVLILLSLIGCIIPKVYKDDDKRLTEMLLKKDTETEENPYADETICDNIGLMKLDFNR